MRVHVLHHAACFDGAASAALFTAFYRACVDRRAEFRYVPKVHRPGDPFDDEDFDADDVAVVDFRYTMDPRLGWFFDHHQSAFQRPGEREHFLARAGLRRFHDASQVSCTGYIASVGAAAFGFDVSPHRELLYWAEVIDAAGFPDPRMPVELDQPAMKLMTFVEHNRDPADVDRFIRDLLVVPLPALARRDYVQAVVEPALVLHRRDIELMRERCRVQAGVAMYDLSDQPPRAYNKFIGYYLHPDVRYLVGISTGLDGRIKLSAGYNPWLPPELREHDIAALCERFDGGGHPYVGGISFTPEDLAPAFAAMEFITAVLRGQRTPHEP